MFKCIGLKKSRKLWTLYIEETVDINGLFTDN